MSESLEKMWRDRLVRANLDMIALRLLQEKPRWGYELNLDIRERFKVYLSAGTLYPLLHSLENQGYIEGFWNPEDNRGKKIYRISKKGVQFLSTGEKITRQLVRAMRFES